MRRNWSCASICTVSSSIILENSRSAGRGLCTLVNRCGPLNPEKQGFTSRKISRWPANFLMPQKYMNSARIGKKTVLWLGLAGVTAVLVSVQRIEVMSSITAHWRMFLLAALFAPFIWIIRHLGMWLKYRQSWDEWSAWTGDA